LSEVRTVSPTRIARQFKAFLDGGPDAPPAPWAELMQLYRVAMSAYDQLRRALGNPHDRAGMHLATAAARRAVRDLHTVMTPIDGLSQFGRDFMMAQIRCRKLPKIALLPSGG
jgi:hypothetical protein